ncbi:MAG: hypothetical protein WBA28_05025 [Microbacteriaceae bacterium]
MDTGNIINLGLFGLTAVATGVSLYQAWQSRQAKDDAIESAKRAESARIEALEANKRASSALESMAFVTGPPWTLVHRNGDTYLLTNESLSPAHNVIVKATDRTLINGEINLGSIGPKSAKYFFAAGTMATKEYGIVVEWQSDTSEERSTWEYPLPARPKR